MKDVTVASVAVGASGLVAAIKSDSLDEVFRLGSRHDGSRWCIWIHVVIIVVVVVVIISAISTAWQSKHWLLLAVEFVNLPFVVLSGLVKQAEYDDQNSQRCFLNKK